MARILAVDTPAPNFDLASTEDVVLMLQDEVARHPVLLYLVEDATAPETRGDLVALGAAVARLRAAGAGLLVVSKTGLPELKSLQRELDLRFPLLHDDRDLSRDYGVAADGGVDRLLVLVGRRREVVWLGPPGGAVAGAMDEVLSSLSGQGRSTANYPRAVINRVVDRRVH